MGSFNRDLINETGAPLTSVANKYGVYESVAYNRRKNTGI